MTDDNGWPRDPDDAAHDGIAQRQAHAERERSERIGHEPIRVEPADDAGPKRTRKPRDEDEEKNGDEEKDSDEKHGDDAKSKKDKGDEKMPKKWSTGKKVLVWSIVAAVLVIAAVGALFYWLHARQFQKTDDAFIDAHYEMVAPQVGGRVIKVAAPDNGVAEPGQVLVEIDPADYQVTLERARAAVANAEAMRAQAKAQRDVSVANVEQANADVDVARSTLDNARAELKRYEGLSKEAVSPQRLDDLRTVVRNSAAQLTSAEKKANAQLAQVGLADSQIVAAEANVKSAQSQADQAQLNLQYTHVKATTGGRITQRNVQAGDYVTMGQQLMILVPRDVYVTANFKETQITDIRPGQEVEIAIDAFPDQRFSGKVDSVQRGSGTVFSLLPPQNATGNYVKVVQRVPVKIVFDSKDGDVYERLGPGMSVEPSVRVR